MRGDGAMKIVELSNAQFDNFAMYHQLNNYCQTSKYAILMSEYGYDYDYIGYSDNDEIKAASMILKKKIGSSSMYGYAPKGFLVDYYDTDLLNNFLNDLRKFYKRKGFVFIKFNPEIIIGETSKKANYIVSYNGNVRIIDNLKQMNVKRRVELQEFDLLLPKFNAYINLKNYDISKINRNFRKKVKKAISRGMFLDIGEPKEMDIYYEFIKNKTKNPISYFRNFYNVFSKDNSIDMVFIKIDFEKYLNSVRVQYDHEVVVNDKLNELIESDPSRRNLNAKIESDKRVQFFKDKIIKATDGLKKHKVDYVAGALVIKNYNRISIFSSGFSDEYRYLNPNHYLYHAIFERYKKYFNYCDLGGISGNFERTSQYYGLNQFKIKWNSNIYEFIGEFDLICNDHVFKRLIKTSFIEDEFNKH